MTVSVEKLVKTYAKIRDKRAEKCNEWIIYEGKASLLRKEEANKMSLFASKK